MCGIAAQFSKNFKPPDKARIRAMAEDISHRGPDDEGYYFGEWFGLGFKRLSILDLSSAGHQPMFDEHRNYVIVYNGELYNFKQIRQELSEKGYKFVSGSDTEVVLKSFIEWGPECLSKFIGMFAFIIVDLRSDRVFTARDHLGIKPLYFYQNKDNIIFASEIKSLRQFMKFSLNEDALYEQFFYRYVSDRQTIFKNIYRLSPGTYMEFDKRGVIREERYYDIAEGLLNPGCEINTGSIETDLKNSIFMHTQSDVGYNIQLSGGIDSSYITAVLARDYGQDLHTYSVTLKGFEKDESRYQNIVADLYGPKHHSFELSGTDMAENLPKATWHMDMPVVHDACVFLMLLCEHSRKHSKVILTGEGADELFGGYGRYSIPFRRKFAFQLKRAIGSQPKMIPNFWKFRTLKSMMSRDIGVDEQIDFDQNASIGLFEGLNKNIPYRHEVADNFPDLLRKIIISDQTSYLNSLLERQDKMAMTMSVETRVPFCTYPLFNSVNAIDPKSKITPVPKALLKRMAEKYYDKQFIYRKKIGFLLPIDSWLRDKKNLGRYLDLLTDSTFSQRGFYNVRAVSKAVDEHLKKEKDWSKDLMNLIKFEIWHRMFIDDAGAGTKNWT